MASAPSIYDIQYGGENADAAVIGSPDQVPFISSVLPNEQLSTLDLPGQLSSIPGGAGTNGAYPGGAADPSGINSLYLSPHVNPTPTGGYLNVLASVANAAATGFSTYVKGSPSVAIPPPRMPGSSLTKPMLTGRTNWLLIGGVVAVGIAVLGFLAWRA